jgi:hypothetical protein
MGFFLGIIFAILPSMKILKSLIIAFTLFGLNSCFIADDLLTENKKTGLTLQGKVENSVKDYIKLKSDGYNYYKYGFSKIIIHKPIELAQLDNLKISLQKHKEFKEIIEAKIKTKEQYIKDNDISYTLEVDHTFSLTSQTTKKIELFETKYFLSDKIEVIKELPLLATQLNQDQETLFADYFFETDIFMTGDYYESKQLSKEFYTYFKQHQEYLPNLKLKSDFLIHSLFVIGETKEIGEFNYDRILRKLASNRLKNNGIIIDYKSIEFSELNEIKKDNLLKGYYFFHKFSHSINNENIISVLLIEFSPYYELTEILEVKAPYEKYFE